MEKGQQFRDKFPNMKFRYVGRDGSHSIEAFDEEGDFGSMDWHPKSGELLSIHVERPYQRHGIGTAMWDEAHKVSKEKGLTPPVHSDTRTEEGDAWAKSLGAKPAKHLTFMPNLDDEDED